MHHCQAMKSIVEVEIAAPRDAVAQLFADPTNNPRWMDDLEAYEPISGQQGEVGSKYRLVPKEGDSFVATVVMRNLPSQLRLELDAPTVAVTISDELVALSPDRTKLISREVFRFKGLTARLLGLLAKRKIHKVHSKHMHSFKRFAEREA